MTLKDFERVADDSIKAIRELARTNKRLAEIETIAVQLIDAMLLEHKAMPKAYEAPETVLRAGVLRARLEALGHKFKGVSK